MNARLGALVALALAGCKAEKPSPPAPASAAASASAPAPGASSASVPPWYATAKTDDASADDSGIRWGTDMDPTPHREQCVLDAGSVEQFLGDYGCREIDPDPVRQPAGLVVTATPSPKRAKPGDRIAVSLVLENRQDKPLLLVFDYDIGSPNDIFGSTPRAPRDPITIEAVRDPGGASAVEYVTEDRDGLAALVTDASAPPHQVQHVTLAARTRAVTDLTWTVPADAKGRWLLRVHTRILWSWKDRKSVVALARVDVSG